ncbi:myosin-light-chain kinase [Toxoplasma gondii ME49]|uniref:Myosin-light-chain kinase n=1 Tax=Toxoplasma gondii (strain ATCC 50611 / Me49) TaxID=508771 RepID=S8F4H9_TOXGM|nr:myosin-light-chain kinase [Toxoplasma gondii ME49]EPT28358.1 myosin-light-chain kinase [Toxoplasma gondii ME49]|eukprot:XP_002365654.2 myosin-light-chain kinase [Toxoplasma gondii ME49]
MNYYTFENSSDAAAASAAAAVPPAPSTRGTLPNGVASVPRGDIRLCLPDTLPNDIPIRRTTKSCFEGYRVLESIGAGTYAHVWKVARTGISKVVKDDTGHGGFQRETSALHNRAAGSRGTECEMLFRHGTHAEEPEVFAAKLLQPQKFSKDTLPQVVDMFTKEIVNLAHCQCPGVVRVEEIVEGAEGWLVVQEYLDGGTLWCDQVCRDEDDAFLHFIQLVQAVLLLQEKNIVHRDLKPTNVLRCKKDKRVLLADFGWSERVDRCQHSQVEWPGTLEINPPEVINCTGPLTERIDNYALGMALMFFLSGRFICRQKGFDATSAAPFVLRTVHQVRSSGPPANFQGPPEAWTLFLGLTAPDPSRRWSLNRVLSHSWVQQKLVQLAPRAHLWHPRVCRLVFQLTRVFADRPTCSGPSRNSYAEQERGAMTPRSYENEFAYRNACMRNSCNGIYPVGGMVEVGGNRRVRATECAFCPPCGITGCTGRPCLKFFMQNRVVSKDDYNKLQTSVGAEAHPAADCQRTSARSTAGSLPTPYEIMLSTDEWKAATLRRRFSAPTLQAFHPFMRFVPRPPPGLAGPQQHQATGGGHRASGQRSANQASDAEYVTPSQTGDSNCAEAKENLRFSVSYAGAAGQSRGTSDCKTDRCSTLPGDAWDLFEQRPEFMGHWKALQQDQNSFQQHENVLSQRQQKRQLQHSHQRQQLTAQCPRSRAGAHRVYHYLRQPQDNPSLRDGWEEKMRSERRTHALGEMGEAPGRGPLQSRRVPSSPSDGRLTQSPVAGDAATLPGNCHQKMHGKLQKYRRGVSHGGTPLQFVTETHAETREETHESATRTMALLEYRQALCRRMEENFDTSSGCESRREKRAALNANSEYVGVIRGQRPCHATPTGAEVPQDASQSPQHAERESSASLPSSLNSKDKAFANGFPRGDASPPPSVRRSSAGHPISESPQSQESVLTQLAPSGACDPSVRPGGASRSGSREEGRLIRTAAQRCLPSRLSFESPLADEPTGPKRTDPPAAGVPLVSSASFCARAGRDTGSRGAFSPQNNRTEEASCGFVERDPAPQVGGTSVDASLKNVQGGGYRRVKTFVPPFSFGDTQVPFFQLQRMPQQATAAYATPLALANGTAGKSGWWRTGATRQFTLGKTTPRPEPPCDGVSPKLPRTLCGGCVSRDSAGSEGCAESGSHRLSRLPDQALGEPRSAGDPPSDVSVGKDCCIHETPREKTEGCSQGTTHGHLQTIVYGNSGAFVGPETGSPRAESRRVSFSGCSPRGPPGGDNSRPQGSEVEKRGKVLSPASASGYGRSSTGAGGGGVADAETVGRLDARHLRELQHNAKFGYGGNAKNGTVSPSGNTHHKEATRGSDPDLAEAAAMMNRDSQGTMAIAGTLTFGGVSPRRNSNGGIPSPTGVHKPSEAAQRKVPGYGETTTTSVLRLVHRSSLPMYNEAILPDGRSPRGAGCSSVMSGEAKVSVNNAHSQEEPWISCLMRNCRGLVQQQMPYPAATETQEMQSQCGLQNDVDTSRRLHADWTGDLRSAGGSGKSGLRTQMLPAQLVLREVQGGGVPESCILQRDLHAFRQRLLQARRPAFHESPHTRGIYEQGAGESEADAASFLQRFVFHLLESGGDLQGRALGPQSATKPLKASVLPLASGVAPFDRRDDMLRMDYRGTGGASAVNAEIFYGDVGSGLRGPGHDEFLLLSSSGGACLKTSPSEAQQLVQMIESTATVKRCAFEGLLEVPSCAGATTTATTTGPGTGTLPASSPGAGEDSLDSGWGFQGLEGEDEPTAFRPESPVCTPIQ